MLPSLKGLLACSCGLTIGFLGLVPLAAETAEKDAQPKGDQLQKAEALVQEVFGRDIQQARLPKQKADLAKEILRAARQEPDSATRFAALQAARRLAVAAQDSALGLEIVREIVASFQPLEQMTPADRLAIADQLWEQAQQLIGAEKVAKQLDAAEAYLQLAPTAAGIVKAKIDKRLGELEIGGPAISRDDAKEILKQAWCVISFEQKRPVWPANRRLMPDKNVLWHPGRNGMCAFFDKKGRIEIVDSSHLSGEKGLSVSALICHRQLHVGEHQILSKDNHDENGQTGWAFRVSADKLLEFVSGNSSRWFVLKSERKILANTWTHVAAVVKNDKCTLYIDGEPEGEMALSFASNSLSVQIGHRALGRLFTNPFDGLIDEIVIWDRAIGPRDLKAIYLVLQKGDSLVNLLR